MGRWPVVASLSPWQLAARLSRGGLLSPAWVGDYPRRPQELSPAFRHDLRVVDLRLGLEESGADSK